MKTPMTPHKAETGARVYDDLGQAIRSIAPATNATEIDNDSAMRLAAGIAVYRNNVRSAFLRVLQDAFPVIHRLVGDGFFRYLAHEYFHAYSPSSPLVARYGDNLPDFLRSFTAASGLPYLPDTARLELAWLGSYHAAEAACLTAERIFELLGEDPESALIDLHPSARFISSPFPLHTIWRHNRYENDEKLRLPKTGEYILTKRPAQRVHTETLSKPVWSTLAALGAKRTLGEALAAAEEIGEAVSIVEIIQKVATSNIVTAVNKTT